MKKVLLILFLMLFMSSYAKAATYMTCEEAMADGQPFVLYLHSDTCAACKHFSPIFNQVMEQSAYNVVDVNYSYPIEQNECSKVETKTIPAVYVVNPTENTYSKIKHETYFDSILFTESLKKLIGK